MIMMMMMMKNSGKILSRLWTKVREIRDNVWGTLYCPMPLPDCVCHVSFRRYSPLNLEVVEKSNKCKSFLEGTTPTFNGRLLARFAVHRLAKCG